MDYKKIFKFALALLITGGLIAWILHQIRLDVFWSTLKTAHYPWILLAAMGSLAIILLNSVQLKLFLPRFRRVSLKKMFQLVAIFSMTVNVVPFWGGHALMIYLLGHRERVGKTVALSVVTLDQIIEGFAKIFIFAWVAFSGPFPPWMKAGMQSFLVLIAVTYSVFFFLAYWYRDHPEELPQAKNHLLARVLQVFKKWAHYLHVLRNWRSLITTILLASLMKFIEVLAVYCVQLALDIPLGLSDGFLVVAALSLATTLPLTPGRLGIFEAAAMLTYEYLGLNATTGLALGVTIHVVHTLPFILAGYLSSLKMGFKRAIPQVQVANPEFEGS